MRTALLAGCLMVLSAAPASAYVLEVIEGTDIPRRWFEERAAFQLADTPPPDGITEAQWRDAAQQALAAWSVLDCGSSTPFVFELLEPGASSEHVISWVHGEAEWTYGEFSIANTEVTVNVDTGQILDVDIELNAVHHQWAIGPTDNTAYDLQNSLTHEAGHALGLDHTPVTSATMHENVERGETADRALDSDDIAGYCALYGPEAPPLPRTEVSEGTDSDEGCSTSVNVSGDRGGLVCLTLLLMVGIGIRLGGRPNPRPYSEG